jgi:hypothetical protein
MHWNRSNHKRCCSGFATLIPATFGIPFADFDAGWQAYMRQRYGIDFMNDVAYPILKE